MANQIIQLNNWEFKKIREPHVLNVLNLITISAAPVLAFCPHLITWYFPEVPIINKRFSQRLWQYIKYTSASILILVKKEWQINSGLHLKSKKSNELKRLYSNKWWNGIKIQWKFLCIYSTNVGTYKNIVCKITFLLLKLTNLRLAIFDERFSCLACWEQWEVES